MGACVPGRDYRADMAEMDLSEREILTWERFGIATRELATEIAADGFRPDMVLAIARGGLTVAGALAYSLAVKNCFAMNVEFYTSVDERLDVPVVLPPMLDKLDIRGMRVLIADDVADTGKTLELVRKEIAEHVAEARSGCCTTSPVRSSRPNTCGRTPNAGSTSRGRPRPRWWKQPTPTPDALRGRRRPREARSDAGRLESWDFRPWSRRRVAAQHRRMPETDSSRGRAARLVAGIVAAVIVGVVALGALFVQENRPSPASPITVVSASSLSCSCRTRAGNGWVHIPARRRSRPDGASRWRIG